ncbi:MAG: molybdate ABC transporter substrate-binding protein [Rhodospirillaceae bacterium]|nr:molybdate ABC transporter substrate-binding protein [Rhodospirillaceae bacterium]MDE0616920.1 molybdate ABC transporter substrate-binding protein [Rhodospirillaceae bacterium]
MRLASALVSALPLVAAPAHAKIGGNGVIFAAASLKAPLDRAVERLVTQRRCLAPGGTIRVSYASSGILARQIRFGAPADLFVSADPRWLDYLERNGRIDPAARRTLFTNRLVAIAHGPGGRSGRAERLAPGTATARRLGRERLAIGDPGHVPAGRYAKAALQSLGLWQRARRNIVLAANVRVVAAYVVRRETALGIVYETDAIAEPRVRIAARIPAAAHPPIRYDAAIVRGGDADCARRWLEALHSPAYRRIFADAGYGMPKDR